MTQPCIITVAITGSLPRKKDNPAVPISVVEQVESTHEAFEGGTTLVHLHVRNDDESPSSAPERFAEVLAGIRRHCPGIITQISTGGRSGAGRDRGGMFGDPHRFGYALCSCRHEPTRPSAIQEVVMGRQNRNEQPGDRDPKVHQEGERQDQDQQQPGQAQKQTDEGRRSEQARKSQRDEQRPEDSEE
jgi:hypothetical protein